ncbi:MAG TPA: ABC transporter ATP-binding protein [Acidimicrobiia bacterium]|nr:ABC transporter ATP-binding protein [Acidimicrobiia bacterium]
MTATSVHGQPASASDDELMVRLSDVTVRFGGITALDGLSFDARRREVLGIIGPNGAGKTTLFDVIAGVRQPNEGTVVLDGRDVTSRSSMWRARNGLRRTFQRVQAFGWLTVEENVLAALEWRGGGGGFVADLVYFPTRRRRERERRARVDEVLERCGLTAVRRELSGSLPIGVARMVELARAIVDEPRVLLLDEPASGLDETETARLGEQIQSVRADTGCTILLVEHNAGFVMQQSDRVLVLNLGTVLAHGSPSEVQRNQAVRDAYLGDTQGPETSDR